MTDLCTVRRTRKVTAYSMNISTGAKSEGVERVETGPCNSPLFGKERAAGICSSCASGWQTDDNYFAKGKS